MKLNSKIILFASSALFCLQTSSFANEKVNLDSVTVVESTFEQNVKSVTSLKLENSQASDIKDILKYIPSVVVDGNARYSQKVYVRGLEDKFSNITIDGARMEGQLFHHSGDQTIDAELLKIGSIELGPNSALSGPGVVNGSFKYETKDPSDLLKDGEKIGARISAGYQKAYDRKSGSVAVFSKVNEKLEFLGLGSITDDGEIEIPGQADVKSKQSELKSGLAKIVFKPNEYNQFKLTYNRYEDGGDRQLSGEKPGNDKTDNDHNEIVRDTYTFNYTYNPVSELINLDAKIYKNVQKLDTSASVSIENNTLNPALYDQIDAIWDNPNLTEAQKEAQVDAIESNPANQGTVKRSDSAKTYENETSGFDIRNISILSNHTLTYGVDYYKTTQEIKAGLDTTQFNNQTPEASSRRANGGEIKAYGLYFEDKMHFDKFVVNLGARYDHHKLGGLYSGTFTKLTPKLKATYFASENLSLRLGYGKIFKGPALGETLTINNRAVQVDNTKAQTGQNIELGFDYDLSSLLNADEASFGFTTYKYNLDNQILPSKNSTLSASNDVEILGFESMFRYQKDDLGFNLSHTYVDGEDEEIATGIKSDSSTSNIHTFKVGVDYQLLDNFGISYDAEFVPGNDRDMRRKEGNKVVKTEVNRSGYAVHNINTNYKFKSLKNAKLLVGMDNIFDKKYARHTSFGTSFGSNELTPFEAGRNIKVKFVYSF